MRAAALIPGFRPRERWGKRETSFSGIPARLFDTRAKPLKVEGLFLSFSNYEQGAQGLEMWLVSWKVWWRLLPNPSLSPLPPLMHLHHLLLFHLRLTHSLSSQSLERKWNLQSAIRIPLSSFHCSPGAAGLLSSSKAQTHWFPPPPPSPPPPSPPPPPPPPPPTPEA